MIPISQDADDLIVACEVGSRAQFEKKYRRPEWPGGKSGVTVGIGYDLGYASAAKIKSDWGNLLPGSMVDAMVRCEGVTGDAAHGLTAAVKNQIDVAWAPAIQVYEHVDIPQWTDRVCRAIPGADKLHPHCIGALTSLAYNRGASFQNAGDRYREMRAIRSHIIAGELDLVDDEIRSMSRLWPGANERGLPIRRQKESNLWNKGLADPIPIAPKPSKPVEDPPPLVPLPPPGGTVVGGAGTVITGTATAKAAHSGLDPMVIAALVAAGIVITIGTVAYLRYARSQPILARAKG